MCYLKFKKKSIIGKKHVRSALYVRDGVQREEKKIERVKEGRGRVREI